LHRLCLFLFGGGALPPGRAFTTTSVSLCIPNPGAESFGSWRFFVNLLRYERRRKNVYVYERMNPAVCEYIRKENMIILGYSGKPRVGFIKDTQE
jgi:hypothetical protein